MSSTSRCQGGKDVVSRTDPPTWTLISALRDLVGTTSGARLLLARGRDAALRFGHDAADGEQTAYLVALEHSRNPSRYPPAEIIRLTSRDLVGERSPLRQRPQDTLRSPRSRRSDGEGSVPRSADLRNYPVITVRERVEAHIAASRMGPLIDSLERHAPLHCPECWRRSGRDGGWLDCGPDASREACRGTKARRRDAEVAQATHVPGVPAGGEHRPGSDGEPVAAQGLHGAEPVWVCSPAPGRPQHWTRDPVPVAEEGHAADDDSIGANEHHGRTDSTEDMMIAVVDDLRRQRYAEKLEDSRRPFCGPLG